ncbi:MAG: hypothetical protein QY312_04120 [Candidatus Dojkabacteria bacterium]|nr:MAG: hypothetical protein QY312_04120 [Candidatus Dojkabacteria bacterium]
MSIFESKHFLLESLEKPEVDRLDGGHVKISPKISVEDISFYTPEQMIDLARLTQVAGIAMKEAMSAIGVEIGRINYQDNGNWTPVQHVHLYCRAKQAKWQKYGDPIIPGNKPEYQPLTREDCEQIHQIVERLFTEERFSNKAWGLQG